MAKQIHERPEQYKVTDNSGDPKYFVQIPRIVWAYARDPYDLMFYSVIKDIAGEHGQCYLSVPTIAALCKMSAGKVQDCRDYWIKVGFIQGEIKQDPGYNPVWHLTISNIWERNRFWAESYTSLEDRVEFAVNQEGSKPATQKTCSRCRKEFETIGKRSTRCKDCQAEVSVEQTAIYKIILMRQKDFLSAGDVCSGCGGTQNLELHLTDQRGKLEILCDDCHDSYHRKFHPMKFPPHHMKFPLHRMKFPLHHMKQRILKRITKRITTRIAAGRQKKSGRKSSRLSPNASRRVKESPG